MSKFPSVSKNLIISHLIYAILWEFMQKCLQELLLLDFSSLLLCMNVVVSRIHMQMSLKHLSTWWSLFWLLILQALGMRWIFTRWVCYFYVICSSFGISAFMYHLKIYCKFGKVFQGCNFICGFCEWLYESRAPTKTVNLWFVAHFP